MKMQIMFRDTPILVDAEYYPPEWGDRESPPVSECVEINGVRVAGSDEDLSCLIGDDGWNELKDVVLELARR